MRKSRFTEEQIAQVLQELGAGAKLADLVRRHGATEQTLYRPCARGARDGAM